MAGPVAVDYSQAQDLAGNLKQGMSDLLNQQQNTSQGLFNQYTAASNAQPKLTDILNTAQSQAGLGDLQGNINLFNTQASGVKTLIDHLNEDTTARTQGTNANQAYLDRMRAVEGGGLNTQLSRLTTGLGDATNAYTVASQGIGQQLTAAQADSATALHPLELQINSLSDQFARQLTGYTTSAQQQLDALMSKLNNQQNLNNQEWQQAADLAKQEQSFQQQRSLIAQQNGSTNTFLGAGLTGSSTGVGNAVAKPGGGFSFTNAAGQPISAATFAAQNNVPIGNLLYRMGQNGDTFAAQTYNNIKSGSGQLPSSLFWGSNTGQLNQAANTGGGGGGF